MLNIRNVYSWTMESVNEFLEDPELRMVAKKLYKEDFTKYCNSMQEELKDLSADEQFQEFIDECLGESDQETFLGLLDAFAKERNLKAYYCDAYIINGDDYWTLYITKVLPLNKKDIQELVEVYLEETGGCSDLSEIVTHKLLGE